MKMKSVLLAFALTGVTSLGLSACTPVGVTVYRDDGYGSHSYRFSGSDANYETNHFSNGDDVGDKVSSIKNNTGYWVAFFKHDTYAGDAICVAPRTNVYDVGDFNVNHDLNQPFESLEDEISSHLRYSSKPKAWNVGGPCDRYIGG